MGSLTVREVAQAFARGERSYTRSNGALRIDDGTLYSYAEPIGKWLDDGTLWITSSKFSVTTSKHTSFLRRSVNGYTRVVETEHWDLCPNCKMRRAHHVDGKCLFDHTSIST